MLYNSHFFPNYYNGLKIYVSDLHQPKFYSRETHHQYTKQFFKNRLFSAFFKTVVSSTTILHLNVDNEFYTCGNIFWHSYFYEYQDLGI